MLCSAYYLDQSKRRRGLYARSFKPQQVFGGDPGRLKWVGVVLGPEGGQLAGGDEVYLWGVDHLILLFVTK